MHPLQKPWSSVKRMPQQEEVKWSTTSWIWIWGRGSSSRGEGQELKKDDQDRGGPSKDKDTKVDKRMAEGDERVEGDKVEIDGELITEEEYLKHRVFVFIHHFSGPVDNLGRAVKEESEKLGLNVHLASVELENGEGLTKTEPYVHHLASAKRGDIDGYHSGFPCDSFTVLRWREAPGLPPPVRSAAAPYGLPGQSRERQEEADKGTVMMSRSL